MIVRLTAEAESDLGQIGTYIARDDPNRALSFLGELRDACLDLSFSPRRFPLARRYERRDIRQRVHGKYLIFYRIMEREVQILRIIHGARDYASLPID